MKHTIIPILLFISNQFCFGQSENHDTIQFCDRNVSQKINSLTVKLKFSLPCEWLSKPSQTGEFPDRYIHKLDSSSLAFTLVITDMEGSAPYVDSIMTIPNLRKMAFGDSIVSVDFLMINDLKAAEIITTMSPGFLNTTYYKLVQYLVYFKETLITLSYAIGGAKTLEVASRTFDSYFPLFRSLVSKSFFSKE